MAAMVAILDFQSEWFYLFLSTSCPNTSYQVWSHLAFWFKRRRAKQISHGCHDSHLGFPIRKNYVIFYLQVAPILCTKIWVNWPFGSSGEAQNRFLRWWTWRPFWIFNWNDFCYFWSTSCPKQPNKFGLNWPFNSKEDSKKILKT